MIKQGSVKGDWGEKGVALKSERLIATVSRGMFLNLFHLNHVRLRHRCMSTLQHTVIPESFDAPIIM